MKYTLSSLRGARRATKQSQAGIASPPAGARNDGKNAFTLIELLIAGAISSVIILSLYSAFQTGILSRAKIDAAFEVYQAARIILSRAETDLKNAFAYTEDDSGFKGSESILEFYSVLDAFDRNGASQPNICLIRYDLGENGLRRACYRGVDALRPDSGIEPEVLSAQAKKINFEYVYATADAQKPYDAQPAWPKENDLQQQRGFPLAVKITLLIADAEFKKIVPLPIQPLASGAPGTSVPGSP